MMTLEPLPAGERLTALSPDEIRAVGGIGGDNEIVIETARKVHILDAVTGEPVGSVPMLKLPALAGVLVTDDSAWFLDHDNGRVIRVDRVTGKVVARIKVGYRAVHLIETEHGLWAGSAHQAPEMAVLIDPATNRVTRRIEQGAFPIWALGSLWFGKDAQALSSDVRRVDPETGNVIATIDMESGARACYIGGRFPDVVWTWCFDEYNPSVAARLDVERNTLAATVPLGGKGGWLGSSATTSWFILDEPHRLLGIDHASNSISRGYTLPEQAFVRIAASALWIVDVVAGEFRRIPVEDL